MKERKTRTHFKFKFLLVRAMASPNERNFFHRIENVTRIFASGHITFSRYRRQNYVRKDRSTFYTTDDKWMEKRKTRKGWRRWQWQLWGMGAIWKYCTFSSPNDGISRSRLETNFPTYYFHTSPLSLFCLFDKILSHISSQFSLVASPDKWE